MAIRCEYVDPRLNISCNVNRHLTKIIIQYPNKKEPIIKYACTPHGDERFRYLSSSEDKLSSNYKQNKIAYTEFSDKLKLIRWKVCRRCSGTFEKYDIKCCVTYFWLNDNSISLRRSFILHHDCLEREMKLFEILKDDPTKVTTLDDVLHV